MMMLVSTNKVIIPPPSSPSSKPSPSLSFTLINSLLNLQSYRPSSLSTSSSLAKLPSPPRLAAVSASQSSTAPVVPRDEKTNQNPLLTWEEFAERASGEWDGFGADFTTKGEPIELPESVVPEAYREWDVLVLDWQTQCPTLASSYPSLHYRLIKLLPTVGCEADAATQYSVDEYEAQKSLAFAFNSRGCYIALWSKERGGKRCMEVEHCLVDPRDRESRMRVVLVLGNKEEKLRLEGIKVFSEYWYGPFRNGEQLGGCAIRETGFASTSKLEASEVVGEWQEMEVAVAQFPSDHPVSIQELSEGKPQKCFRDEAGLITLPKNLWCSLNENDSGESLGEVGWLLDNRSAMITRCVFNSDRQLKEVATVREVRTN